MTGQKNQRSKYFLGIVIPSPHKEKIEKIKNELFNEHNLKGALRSPAHITLHRPFEWPEEKEEQLIRSLTEFSQPGAFEIELKDFGYFIPRVIFVGVQPNEMLAKLHDSLSLFAKSRLRLFNEVGDMRGFHPHVTVAFRDLKPRKFEELKPVFQQRTFSGSFNFAGFSLLKLDKTWMEHFFFPLYPR